LRSLLHFALWQNGKGASKPSGFLRNVAEVKYHLRKQSANE
jgi:hypothetical protein